MLIDWFTVGAQALNFLILVWLLKRYLYRPVLAAIDARQQKVAGIIADAAAQDAKAQAAGEDLRQRREAFDRDREGLMRRAADEAAAEGQRLRELARGDSQLLRARLTQALTTERAELGRQVTTRAQAEVFEMVRKALTDLADIGLEERMIDVFIERLASAKVDTPAARPESGTVPVRAALVRSAFDLSAAGRARIEVATRQHCGANVTVRFETYPELICGIELTVDGVRLAWSVSNYLSTLAQDVEALTATNLTAGLAKASLPVSPAVAESAHAG